MNINEYINTYKWIHVVFYKKPNKGSVDKVSYFLHDLSSKSFLCSFLCRKGQRKVKSWDISQKTDNDSTYNSYFYNHIMWISLTSSKSVDYISYYWCNEIASGDVSTQINVFAERFFVQVWIYWMCRDTNCYDICGNLEPIDEVWSYCSMRSAYHSHEELACTKKNQFELASHEQHVAVTLYWKFIVNRRKYAIYFVISLPLYLGIVKFGTADATHY